MLTSAHNSNGTQNGQFEVGAGGEQVDTVQEAINKLAEMGSGLAVEYDDDTKSAVTLNKDKPTATVRLTGLADGSIHQNSDDAVTGRQIYNITQGETVQLGQNSQASGEYAVALGYYSKSAQKHSVAIGEYASTEGEGLEGGVAIGSGAQVWNSHGVAIGKNATAFVEDSIAIGKSAEASGANSVALGANTTASEANTVAVGNRTLSQVTAAEIKENGTYAATTGQLYTTDQKAEKNASDISALDGRMNTAENSISDNADAIAQEVTDRGEAITAAKNELNTSIKANADAIAKEVSDRTSAIAQEVTDRDNAITAAKNELNTNIGNTKTELEGKITTAQNTLQGNIDTLGGQVTALDNSVVKYDGADKSKVTLKAANNGNVTLSGIADGSAANDAVNVRQLTAAETALNEAIEQETTARGEAITAAKNELNTSIQANADAIAKEVSDRTSAIAQEVTDRNSAITAAKNELNTSIGNTKTELEGKITTAQNTLQGNIDTLGGQVTALDNSVVKYDGADKSKVTLKAANNGNVTLSGIADGSAANDAVNVRQLTAAETALNEAIEQETTARGEAITAAKNELNTSIEANADAIAKEVSDRTSAIAQEVTNRDNAITAAKNELNTNIGNTKTELEGKITTAQNTLQGNIDTAKSELNKNIGDTKTALEQSIGSTEQKLTQNIETVESNLTASIGSTKTELQTNINNLGESAKDALGGGSTYSNGTLTAKLTVGGTDYDSVQKALNAVNTEAEAKGSWTLQANGGSAYTVNAGSTVNLVQDGNITVTADGNGNVTFGMKENPTFGDVVTAKGFTVASGGSGIDMNGTKVTNLAEGDISSASSKEAVTGGQLFTAQDTLQGNIDSARQELSKTISDTRTALETTISETKTALGNRITAIDDVAVKYASKDSKRLTLTDSGNSVKIGNVAEGTADTDAANVGQMKAAISTAQNTLETSIDNLGESAAKALGGGSTYSNGTLTAKLTVGGTEYDTVQKALSAVNTEAGIKGEWTLSANGANKAVIGDGGAVNLVQDGNITVTADGQGNVTFGMKDAPTFNGLVTANGGIDMNGTKVTNLAEGDISSAGSKDAVTGGQLFTAKDELTKSISASQSALEAEMDALGGSVASALGGSSSFDAGTNTVTASFTRQFSDVTRAGGYDSAQKVIDSIDKQFASIGGQVASIMGGGVTFNGDGTGTLSGFSVEINGETFTDVASAIGKLADGWTFATDGGASQGGAGTGGTSGGSSNIKPGDTLTVNGGSNITIKQDGDKQYTVDTVPNPTFDSVTAGTVTASDSVNVANGKVTADASGVIVTGAGGSSVKIDGDSVSVADTVTIDKDGADMGGTKVTNMADGSVQAGSTDAVTGNQLHNTGSSLAGILDDGGKFTVDESGTVSGKFTIGGEEQASLQDALDKLASGTGGSVEYTEVNL